MKKRLLLGVEPYVDSSYYTGFRTDDMEIGLDPHARSSHAGRGLLIATVKDADGNTLGLRQTP